MASPLKMSAAGPRYNRRGSDSREGKKGGGGAVTFFYLSENMRVRAKNSFFEVALYAAGSSGRIGQMVGGGGESAQHNGTEEMRCSGREKH